MSIDITSLDDVTKEKIAKLSSRLDRIASAGAVDEIVGIVRFSDGVADKLGVDKNEFLKQYFWA